MSRAADPVEHPGHLARAEHVALDVLQEAVAQQFAQPELRARAPPLPVRGPPCARGTRSMAAHNSVTPCPDVASVRMIGGRQAPAGACCSDCMASIDATVRSAPSRSALFTTKTSAISMMPALRACTSSPAPGTTVTIDTSAVRTMSTSSCPTPTVSMMTTSRPAASSTSATSLVARASPPRCPRVAMLRMNTPGSAACACMRTRSPRIAPPVNGLVGSTAIDPHRQAPRPAGR